MLIKHGADVHAKDKGGLVPLHNACSYGHYEVAELLVKVKWTCMLTELLCHKTYNHVMCRVEPM